MNPALHDGAKLSARARHVPLTSLVIALCKADVSLTLKHQSGNPCRGSMLRQGRRKSASSQLKTAASPLGTRPTVAGKRRRWPNRQAVCMSTTSMSIRPSVRPSWARAAVLTATRTARAAAGTGRSNRRLMLSLRSVTVLMS